MKDLKDKTCFLTGAASGIGRSFAKALAKQGMKLFIIDIDTEGLKQVKTEIEQEYPEITVYSMKCDVSKLSDFEAAFKEFYSKYGDVDLLLNNAGIGVADTLANIDLKLWKNVLDINLMSIIYSLKVFLPHMLERKSGHIVNVASGAGIFGSSEPLPYITSKFAVVGLSEGLFSHLKNYDINVSVIVPGYIRTNIFDSGIKNSTYDPKMLKDFGKEKLEEVYNSWMENIINSAMSPDVAVRKYIRQIKKDQLYIFDSASIRDILALKGKTKEYEAFLLNYQEMQAKDMREHFHEHGINIEDYM
ncbi:MAG: SDR family NAD(P)-dependent oxidoreductase [Promethearchaeota archaeon]